MSTATVAGAVFWLTDNEGDDGVNGETVGYLISYSNSLPLTLAWHSPYLALSAYLFEATSNSTYGIAAEVTASFIQNHMYNGDIVQDFFNVKTCKVTTRQTIPSYDTGFAIEGLASWANISGNATWSNLATRLVSSSAVYSVWTGPDGVIIEVAGEGQPTVFNIDNLENGFKAFLMRGLHEAWLRIPNSLMSKYIKAYITVQYNALLTMTSNESPGKVYYNSSWTGPAPSELHPYPQVIALHLLNPALDISQRNSPTVSNSSSPKYH
ncbi:hypothetical protein OF83DRAFT_440639 [Amylostereum chailletii]|nr:hypothetical protein OF83DRAFT_440639 [Amylostereum chailletii]